MHLARAWRKWLCNVILALFPVIDAVTDVNYSLPYFSLSEENFICNPRHQSDSQYGADVWFLGIIPVIWLSLRTDPTVFYRINACDRSDKYESLKAEFAGEVGRLSLHSHSTDNVRKVSVFFRTGILFLGSVTGLSTASKLKLLIK